MANQAAGRMRGERNSWGRVAGGQSELKLATWLLSNSDAKKQEARSRPGRGSQQRARREEQGRRSKKMAGTPWTPWDSAGLSFFRYITQTAGKSSILEVSSEDSRAQFLIPSGSLGQNRAEASLNRARNLNPMVSVEADTENINQKSDDFFTQFDVVCLTSCPSDLLVRVNHICHKHNIKFFTGDVYGYHGSMFADLGEHEFVEEKAKVTKAKPLVEDGPEAKKAKIDPTETILVKKKVQFCPLKDALEIDWRSEKAKSALKKTPTDYFLLQVLMKFRTDKGRDPQPSSYQEDSELLLQICSDVLDSLGVSPDLLPKDFASYCFSEMAPVCAVVGGVLGQEIVKALSLRDAPHNNFFFFDGKTSNGIVDCLGSK